MSGPLKSTARKDLDTRIRCPGPSRHPDASILRVQWDQRENSALDLASGWKRENLLLKYSKAVDRAFDSGGMKRTAEIKKSPGVSLGFLRLAERTGLEPATPGVTGRYSNQLNYRSKLATASRGQSLCFPAFRSALQHFHAQITELRRFWRSGRGSNPRPPA